MEKKCSSCKMVKQDNQFHNNKSKQDGLHSHCKSCRVAENKITNAKTRERVVSFLNAYKTPDEQLSDAAIRYFCEVHGYKKWAQLIDQHASFDEGGCVVWNGVRNAQGYGHTHVILPQGTNYVVRAHRLAYAVHYGHENLPHSSFAPGVDTPVLDHMCVNASCVNPIHLQVTTHSENVSYRWSRAS